MYKDTTKIRALEKDIRIFTYLALTGAEFKSDAFRALCMKSPSFECHLCAWIRKTGIGCWDCPANMGEDFCPGCIYSERSMYAQWYCAKSKKERTVYAQRFLNLLWEWRMNEAMKNWPHHAPDYIELQDITKADALRGEIAIWRGRTSVLSKMQRPVGADMSLAGKFRYTPLCTWGGFYRGDCSPCPANFGVKGLRGCENSPDSPLAKLWNDTPWKKGYTVHVRAWIALLEKWLKEEVSKPKVR